MAEELKHTVIENGTDIDGTIKSEGPIVLSGSIKGRISTPFLEVTPSGKVHGTVHAAQFFCKGEVGGEVVAEVVELSGRVCDATVIQAKTLDVKVAQGDGGVQVTFGNCELKVGDLPARAQAKPSASAKKVPTDVVDAVSDLMT